jgi:hypothetical protein
VRKVRWFQAAVGGHTHRATRSPTPDESGFSPLTCATTMTTSQHDASKSRRADIQRGPIPCDYRFTLVCLRKHGWSDQRKEPQPVRLCPVFLEWQASTTTQDFGHSLTQNHCVSRLLGACRNTHLYSSRHDLPLCVTSGSPSRQPALLSIFSQWSVPRRSRS